MPVEYEGRPIADVIRDVNAALTQAGIEPDEYGFSSMAHHWPQPADGLWPTDYKWIACFAVRGGSEGYYVHIELLGEAPRRMVALAKTWSWELAFAVANATTRLLDS